MLDVTLDGGARADQRLRSEEVIWLTTVRADGQPQSVPIWFLWDGQTILIYSQPNQQKLRNIRRNPRVALNLNAGVDGNDIVRIEGTATILADAPPATAIRPYIEKYQTGIRRLGTTPAVFAREYAVGIRVTPERFHIW